MATLTQAAFTRMDESTAEDWAATGPAHQYLEEGLADRVLRELRELACGPQGFAVDRLTHSVQTAHRAEKAGRDDEYLVCALVHDIGDLLTPHNHPDLAAAILKPFVSEANLWMVQMHGVFQGYYFWHHVGRDRNSRDAYEGHPHYDRCAEFCAEYDMPAFDPAYPTPSLEHYEPLVRSFFASPA
ncbi:HD domain-containing protein [Candidatus Poriferisocius sp.]|uniref:HD domain-containing protein n=1 Tax=Candidatus Poriferisocius sp. TaxID=3101276 RepID=UPI003B59A4B8